MGLLGGGGVELHGTGTLEGGKVMGLIMHAMLAGDWGEMNGEREGRE